MTTYGPGHDDQCDCAHLLDVHIMDPHDDPYDYCTVTGCGCEHFSLAGRVPFGMHETNLAPWERGAALSGDELHSP